MAHLRRLRGPFLAAWVIVLCFAPWAFSLTGRVSPAAAVDSSPAVRFKPYRVLLVVGQRSDPSGLVVSSSGDKFQPVAALLQAWSVPFDIIDLNVQHLDGSYLFRRSGNIRYGAVVWMADPQSYGTQNLAALQQASRDGTSLIAIDSRVLDPALDQLLGLKFKEVYTSTEDYRVAQQHYLTRDIVAGKNPAPAQGHNYANRLWVQPTTAEVLVQQGQHPIVTVDRRWPVSSEIWLGPSGISTLCTSGFWRSLFFRSLVWSVGYAVTPNVDYSHRIILELDDWGTADKGFLSYWRYLEPDAETIRKDLILPLQQHHAIASAEVDSGYVDRESKRIVSPWIQTFTDNYGLHQNYISTHKGLKDAMNAGVLNIESHGWTHMEPDLDSPPGPWWTADLAGEASAGGWYVEFDDQRRGKEVPAATQVYHMERSLAALQQDFGVQALELKPGGDAWSKSRPNNTAALAARVGFGLFHGDTATYYLDPTLVLDMAGVIPDFGTGYDTLGNFHPERWPDHPDGPVILGFHDRDIALDHNFMNRLFAALPGGYRTIGTNRYVAILHTHIASSNSGAGLQLTFSQDGHYCAYFATHSSSWRLWLSDPLREQLGVSNLQISVDGQSATEVKAADLHLGTLIVRLPAGTGIHTWELVRIKNHLHP